MAVEKLLPEVLKDLWETVDELSFTGEQFYSEKERLLDNYRQIWKRAILLPGYDNLRDSLLSELSGYLGLSDLTEVERRCKISWRNVEDEWHGTVDASRSATSIEHFYDQTEAYLYNLIWWHTLTEDDTPLAYVTALGFAQRHGCSRYLDFGSGISSGGLLFHKDGFEVASADVSSSLLHFSEWRFAKRGIAAQMIDLKERALPSERFDFVTAMDVWEHLVDPVGEVDRIANTLVPGGVLYGRFAMEPDDERPQHIVRDFKPVFERLRALGFQQVWEDDWLWGHQVYRKP
jgi:SAM-dependent methyltransferase